MKKIPVYVNPYDKVHFGPSTVMTLHRFGIFDPDVARRVPTLSPFSAKLTAHLRFQGIPFEPVAEQGVGNAPRGKVPFITVDGVKVADSDLVIGFLKTAFPDPDAGLSDHQRAVGHLVQRTLEDHLYWIALIYEFYDQEGSDWFFEHAFGGIGPAFRGCGTTWKTAPTSRASRVIRPTKSWTRRPRTSRPSPKFWAKIGIFSGPTGRRLLTRSSSE